MVFILPMQLLAGGYLGKSNNIVIYGDELLTHGMYSIEYQRIFNRHFSLVSNFSHLNNSFKADDGFKLIGEEGGVKVRGNEFHIGMIIGSMSANNVLPVGMSNGFKFGFGSYSAGDSLISNKYSTFCFEYITRSTFNVYKNLNGFVGINIGVINAFGGDLEKKEDYFGFEDGYNPFYLVQRGINKNYSLSGTSEAFLFRFCYGISYVFGK